MDFGIQGKVALVTASSAGMGRSIAHALAKEGSNVVLFARSAEKLQGVADELMHEYGVRALPVAGSMLDAADVSTLAQVVQDQFGGLDILVLNTARAPNPLRATVDENDLARWQEAYDNQLRAVIQMTNTTLPLMLNRGWGRIIAITSASVKSPMPHHALSTVFRAGVSAYIKHLANEIGARGITANCVAPALIDTSHRIGAAAYTEEQAAARKKLTPLGRMGTQEEVSSVVAFLASRQAGFVTGSTIPVEGGMVGGMI